jgi:hypothetical protein
MKKSPYLSGNRPTSESVSESLPPNYLVDLDHFPMLAVRHVEGRESNDGIRFILSSIIEPEIPMPDRFHVTVIDRYTTSKMYREDASLSVSTLRPQFEKAYCLLPNRIEVDIGNACVVGGAAYLCLNESSTQIVNDEARGIIDMVNGRAAAQAYKPRTVSLPGLSSEGLELGFHIRVGLNPNQYHSDDYTVLDTSLFREKRITLGPYVTLYDRRSLLVPVM